MMLPATTAIAATPAAPAKAPPAAAAPGDASSFADALGLAIEPPGGDAPAAPTPPPAGASRTSRGGATGRGSASAQDDANAATGATAEALERPALDPPADAADDAPSPLPGDASALTWLQALAGVLPAADPRSDATVQGEGPATAIDAGAATAGTNADIAAAAASARGAETTAAIAASAPAATVGTQTAAAMANPSVVATAAGVRVDERSAAGTPALRDELASDLRRAATEGPSDDAGSATDGARRAARSRLAAAAPNDTAAPEPRELRSDAGAAAQALPLAELRPAEAAAPTAGAATAIAGPAGAAAAPPAWVASATAAHDATPPAEVRLPVPITSPEFAPRFGTEITLLARDGVQEARVHVHPAEMGPIAVQITLDGAQAQVHLVAEHAHTRTLLEQSMPSLAAALRESGLTLTGGGVFEQPRQPREPDRDAPHGAPRGSADSARGPQAEGAAAAATRLVRRQGVVDFYA